MKSSHINALAGLLAALALPLAAQVTGITNGNLEQFRQSTSGPVNGPVAGALDSRLSGPALDLPQDRGAHRNAARERWVLKAMLRDPGGQPMPLQLTFVIRNSDAARHPGAWSRSRILGAQASLGLEGGRRLLLDARHARIGIPGEATEDRVGLRCDGWSLTDPGDGKLHLDLPLQGGRVQATFAYSGEPLSLPPLDAGDPLRRTLRAPMVAQGMVRTEGRWPLAVTGKAMLLQEWGPDLPPEIPGWASSFVFFQDGRTGIYLDLREVAPTASPRSLFMELDPKGQPTRIHHPPPPKVRRSWTSPASRAKYPVTVQIQDPRQPLTFEPFLDAQEWQGDWAAALTQWCGAGRVKDLQGAWVGEAFFEQAGLAHPIQGRY